MEQKIKVIVADDEESHLELICRSLSKETNYEIILSDSLSDLLKKVESVNPYIVLTDYNFFDGNARIFIDKYYATLPVIVMTSFGNEKLAVELIKAGAIDYIVKSPETFANIKWIIERTLREWGLTLAHRNNLRALKESEERFRQLAEAITEIFWLVNLETRRIEYLSPAFETIYGFNKDEISQEKDFWSNIIHPLDRDKFFEAINNFLEKKEMFQLQFRIVIPDGGIRWVNTRTYPVYNEKGEIYKLSGITEDITERKIWEENNKLLAEILNIAPASVIIHDLDGNLIYFNKKAYEMHGYTSGEYKVLNIKDVLVKEDANLVPERIALILKQGYASFETLHTRKDGTLFPLLVFAESIKWQDQDVILSVSTDITKIKEAEKEILLKSREMEAQNEILQHAKEKAEESDKLKSAFLANMSHEIRTPMNGIIGFSDLLENRNLNEQQRQQYIQVIKNSGLQLLSIINDIIDISKIETGQLTLSKEAVSIEKVLNELYIFFQPLVEKKSLRLILNNNTNGIGKIYTDEVKLKQILTNLLSNALKFTDNGLIELGASLVNNNIEFYVKDTGIGIPEDYKDIIFERFRQADYNISGKHGGTGLGLAISKAYIDLMGGEIRVNSERGAGSTFYFTVPYNRVVQGFKKEEIKKGLRLENPDYSDKSILIAEDEMINFMYLNEILFVTNAKIKHVANGKEVLELIDSGEIFDLIFMDLKMPFMDGYETTRKIREMNFNMPIIAITAFTLSDERDKAFEAGCNDFIHKPYRNTDIYEILVKFFDNK